ncbi:MAG: peptidyl-prolyl cis-trans isomerase [Lachnospiraceae bacterium]|nr:peptidyl-prolyl cis-trans isomerase [Lachnospiraceae bacterium]
MTVCAGMMAAVLFFVPACNMPVLSALTGNYVFSVGSEKCSVEEAKVILLQYQKEYSSFYGIDLWEHDSDTSESLEQYIRDMAVSQLAEIYTLYVIAGEREMELTEDEKVQAAAAAAEYMASLAEDELDYIGATESEVEALYEKYLLAHRLYTSLTEDVSSEVSDDEARVMDLKQICVSEEETAEQLLEQLDGGADFSSLAESYNESGTSDLQVSRMTYSDAVTEILFSMNTGEYSEVIGIDDSYYIFYCVDYFNEALTEENKANVVSQRMEAAVTAAYNSYLDSLDSFLNEAVWSEVTVDTELALDGSSFGEVYDSYFESE